MLNDDERPEPESYEVGYGRPPKHTRFTKGQSGNPRGRPSGSRALKTDLDEALKAMLTITVGGRKRSGTTQALAMYALAMKSATGDLKAVKVFTDLIMTVFGPGDRSGAEARLSRQDEELLERMLARFEPEAAEGSEMPAPSTSRADDGEQPEKGHGVDEA